MTKERRIELTKYRHQIATQDQQREIAGQLLDGIKQIEEALAKPVPLREAVPEMIMAGKGGKIIKGKKVAVRR